MAVFDKNGQSTCANCNKKFDVAVLQYIYNKFTFIFITIAQ